MLKTGKKFYSENAKGYLLILPWILGFLLFQLWPILHSFYLSFTDYNILGPARFAGLNNYARMMKDPLFFQAVKVTFQYVIMAVPLKLIFALFIALILNQSLKGISFFRTVYYIPSIFGASVAVSILWKALFIKNGLVNLMLAAVGIEGPAWLGSPKLSLFTVALLNVWQFGSSMVIFLAGLKQIPAELYEAARVDGAGTARCFLHITLPGIAPLASFNVLMQTIFAFQMFATPYTIFGGKGGPLNSTLLYVIYLYQHGFQYFDMGYSSALSWVLLCIIGAVGFGIRLFEKRFVYDD